MHNFSASFEASVLLHRLHELCKCARCLGQPLKGPFSMLNDEQMSSSNWGIWIELLAAWMELKFLEERFKRGIPPKRTSYRFWWVNVSF